MGHDDHFDDAESVKHYAAHMERFGGMYGDFVKHLKSLGCGNRFLEIGPGTGLLTSRVAAVYPDASITALDLSPQMTEYGREYVSGKGFGDRVKWIVGNAEDSEFLTSLGKFDLIYSSLTLHEFSDAKSVIKTLNSALSENGVLSILDLRRVWWLNWIPSKEGFFSSIRSAYQPNELRTMLGELGFARCEVRTMFPFLLSITIRK